MTHTTTTPSGDQREKTFDEYYREVMALQPHSERFDIAEEVLKKKYGDYRETKEFIGFLRNVEEIFAAALKNKWTVEKTQDEMIKSEIYLLSQSSGVDEEVFLHIYEEFKVTSSNVQTIQETADRLLEVHAGDEPPHPECREFISFVRDTILLFAKTKAGDTAFDEIIEVKQAMIYARMLKIAEDNDPPMEVLQNIFEEFTKAIHNASSV